MTKNANSVAVDQELFRENAEYFVAVVEMESIGARLDCAIAVGRSDLIDEIVPELSAKIAEVKKLERKLSATLRPNERKISRGVALKEFVEKTVDEIIAADARIQILSKELEAAELRDDLERALELVRDLKAAREVRSQRRRTFERLHVHDESVPIIPPNTEKVN